MPEPRRLPNLFHFFLLLVFTLAALIPAEALVLAIARPHPLVAGFLDQKLQLFANALTYLIALASAYFLLPFLWHRRPLAAIEWNARNATPLLALLGLVLGWIFQFITRFLPTPKKMPIEEIFHNPHAIWLLVAFGTLLAPLFEEVLFRGFLLPALAIAVDWARLPRPTDPLEALTHLDAWRASDAYSPLALTASSVITSILFALIHAPQLGYTWSAITLLLIVSLILCYIRIRTRSVAASTLVHACYNFSVFVTIFIATSGFRHLDKA